MNILIADDELRLRKVVATFLRKSGIDVSEVSSGEQALEALKSKIPDVIVMDITMPGMDGLEACRKIKSNPLYENIPVLLLTATISPNIRAEGLKAGAASYLTKPFSQKDLLEHITNLKKS
ncbi:MAG: response regulator [Deferribacteraceae bacterium]|jgi:CheY-like chemotaxis protein|nr:response regulator [Deferribacteraceae bacterium]